ncbi:MAG: ABC transporter ATP-binding protein [Planctomycetes bacterium]|nr:ABC transporter ATP-binding protein [Planctomycetota bacterium]
MGLFAFAKKQLSREPKQLLFLLVAALLDPIIAIFISRELYKLIENKDASSQVFYLLIVMFFLAVAIKAACSLFREKFSIGVRSNAQKELFSHLLQNPPKHLSHAEVLNRVNTDYNNILSSLSYSLPNLVVSLIRIVGILIYLFPTEPLIAITALALPLLAVPFFIVIRKGVSLFSKGLMTSEDQLFSLHKSTLEHLDYFQVSGRLGEREGSYEQALRGRDKHSWGLSALHSLQPSLAELMRISFVLVILYLWQSGREMLFPVDGLYLGLSLLSGLSQCLNASASFQGMKVHWQRVREILYGGQLKDHRNIIVANSSTGNVNPSAGDSKVSAENTNTSTEDKQLAGGGSTRPKESIICHKWQVYFGPDQHKHGLLPLDFHWQQGDTALVQGSSGSGKSTLLKSLIALHQNAQGQLDIHAGLSNSCAYVAQNPEFWPGSFRENMAFPEPFSPQEEKELNMWVHTMDLDDLPWLGDWDKELFRANAMPSRGQLQRLALLRAVWQKPAFLILDEPSTGLDEGLWCKILVAIRQHLPDSLIVIAEHQMIIKDYLEFHHVLKLNDLRVQSAHGV